MPYRFGLTALSLLLLISGLFRVYLDENVKKTDTGRIARVVSLSPSLTAQIIDLDAGDIIAGVTTFSPPLGKNVEIVGPYVNPSPEKISSLKPDAVLISYEDQETQRISSLKRLGFRCIAFGRNGDFESICRNYLALGGLLGRGELAQGKLDTYRKRLAAVERPAGQKRVVFLISVKPLVTVSGGSYIAGIIRDAGGINLFDRVEVPYPILTAENLLLKNPDVVIVMNEGDDALFLSEFSGFVSADFIRMKSVFAAGCDHIPYYTPGEYLASVEIISGILRRVKCEKRTDI